VPLIVLSHLNIDSEYRQRSRLSRLGDEVVDPSDPTRRRTQCPVAIPADLCEPDPRVAPSSDAKQDGKSVENVSRRQVLAVSAGMAVLLGTGASAGPAMASTEAEAAVKAFTSGREPVAGRIALSVSQIAEDGNNVPVSISVESPMTDDDHVVEVLLVATRNPSPVIATFRFSALSGTATASTRVRLAETQHVVAIARMKDGSVFRDQREVKVTIGGCGG
jgi:sulfur-oxidizing protein SoxY